MSKTQTQTKAPAAGALPKANQDVAVFKPPRLAFSPMVEERFGIDRATWRVLVDAIWPSAKTVDSIVLALSYCRAHNLDPLKRPVHIVPVWSSEKKEMIETIWPGISELRTTAVRTKVYAGKDAAVFGPRMSREFEHSDKNGNITKAVVEFPEWCMVTVYRIVDGHRCAFVGPKVYWLEAYATKDRYSLMPNEMWADRTSGQLEKCAEAASLRAAFPEYLGNEYAAEEMWGKTINGAGADEPPAPAPAPKREDFKKAAPQATAVTIEAEVEADPATSADATVHVEAQQAETAEADATPGDDPDAVIAEWTAGEVWKAALTELSDAKDEAARKAVAESVRHQLGVLKVPEIVLEEWKITAMRFEQAIAAAAKKKGK